MYEDIRKYLSQKGYTSISEFFRDAARDKVYPEVTENGFTPEFEEAVFEAAKEPIDHSKTWKTEKDIHDYFENLRKELKIKRRNGKN